MHIHKLMDHCHKCGASPAGDASTAGRSSTRLEIVRSPATSSALLQTERYSPAWHVETGNIRCLLSGLQCHNVCTEGLAGRIVSDVTYITIHQANELLRGGPAVPSDLRYHVDEREDKLQRFAHFKAGVVSAEVWLWPSSCPPRYSYAEYCNGML